MLCAGIGSSLQERGRQEEEEATWSCAERKGTCRSLMIQPFSFVELLSDSIGWPSRLLLFILCSSSSALHPHLHTDSKVLRCSETQKDDRGNGGHLSPPGQASPTSSTVDTGQVPEEKPEEKPEETEAAGEGGEGAEGDGDHVGALGVVALPGTCCVCIEMERINNCLHSEKICILPILACLLSLALCTAGLKWVFVDKIFEYEPPTHLDPKPIGQDPIIISVTPTLGLTVSIPHSSSTSFVSLTTAITSGRPDVLMEEKSTRGPYVSPRVTHADASVTLKYSAERPTLPKLTPLPRTTQERNDIFIPTKSAGSTTMTAKTSSHMTRCSDKQRNYCVNGGECFTLEIMPGSTKFLCRCLAGFTGHRCEQAVLKKVSDPKRMCPNEFTGDRCQNYVMASFYKTEELYQKRIITITGICIALLVVGIMCVVAYCKTKKRRKELHDRVRQSLRKKRNNSNKGVDPNMASSARGGPTSNLPLQDLQLINQSKGKTAQHAADGETETTFSTSQNALSAHEPTTFTNISSQRVSPVRDVSPLSSLAISVPSVRRSAPLLLSNKRQSMSRDEQKRNSAHYNHGHEAHSLPPSPLLTMENGYYQVIGEHDATAVGHLFSASPEDKTNNNIASCGTKRAADGHVQRNVESSGDSMLVIDSEEEHTPFFTTNSTTALLLRAMDSSRTNPALPNDDLLEKPSSFTVKPDPVALDSSHFSLCTVTTSESPSLNPLSLTMKSDLNVLFFIFCTVEVSLLLEYCPTGCQCDWDIYSVSCFGAEVIPLFHSSTQELFVVLRLNIHGTVLLCCRWMVGTQLSSIPENAFSNLANISHIYISDDDTLKYLEKHSFHNLSRVSHIGITNTGLTSFPGLQYIQSSQDDFLLYIVENVFIQVIPANSFTGISENTLTIMLNSNGVKEIQRYAFNGSRLEEVDLSETKVSSLPSIGMETIEKLQIKNTWALKVSPPFRAFLHLQSAELTFPSHCCGLKMLKRWRGHSEAVFCNLTRTALKKLQDSSQKYPVNEVYQHLKESSAPPADGSRNHNHLYDSPTCPTEQAQNEGLFYVELPTEHLSEGFDFALCDELRTDTHRLLCTPLPDALNPCEDVMSQGFLRVLVWVVSLLAISANFLVMFILLTSRQKLSVTRFLMGHLAFADFCMGIYLLFIASVDLYTRSHYYHYAIAWQTGSGCNLAGTLSVFASELSVYTLTLISLQRWHAIFYAMRPDRKMRLRHAAVLMLIGWLLCLILALLPVVGVSSFQKVSICLPMDTETTAARTYVVSLLMVNVVAFMVVCLCYLHIYCMVHNPQHQSSKCDTTMAKRMAVLIFTNFLCLAPICFYGLFAALHQPLMTITDSKAFHRDILMLLSRMGLCQRQAHLYRSQQVNIYTDTMSPHCPDPTSQNVQ
ncbi:hypothetical protein F7725_015219 [Dissostichus mawsoni]|uniref:Thyrotropin receptor n=1 Tax=Dissostichus mawsoni TaxID=36200 RepID=A0A7J5YGU5_DISMA|nr:hypothetical protein F7725_015219 [Dissostichus mawsoni]